VPHLHFQLQRTEPLGSPTLPGDFGDVIVHADGGQALKSRVVPREGDRVRAVMTDPGLARAVGFSPGAAFELEDETTGRVERAHVEIDLMGRRLLRSERAALTVDTYEGGFVVVDFTGDPASLLRDVVVALARVPFDRAAELTWEESVPRRLLVSGWLRAIADLLSVFAPEAGGVTMRYRERRDASRVVISGESPEWSTVAELSLGGGNHRLQLRHRGVERRVVIRPMSARAKVTARADAPEPPPDAAPQGGEVHP
jgi:hypothetical protein